MTAGQTLQTLLEILAILGIGIGFLLEQRVALWERRMLRRWKRFHRRMSRSKKANACCHGAHASKRAA